MSLEVKWKCHLSSNQFLTELCQKLCVKFIKSDKSIHIVLCSCLTMFVTALGKWCRGEYLSVVITNEYENELQNREVLLS